MSKLQEYQCKDCAWETNLQWIFTGGTCFRCKGQLEWKHTTCYKCDKESNALTFTHGRRDHNNLWHPPLWLCPKCNKEKGEAPTP